MNHKRIAVLMTVHNRKEKTLQCLRNLFSQNSVNGYVFEVWLTDDGCTDGTPEAVALEFPEIHIVSGDGSLFWNRGMYTAWQEADKTCKYDYFLWLNDDTYLYKNALKTIIEAAEMTKSQSIIVGATCSAKDDKTTYGGSCINGKLLTPDGSLQECDITHGNFLLVPRYVYEQLGNLDWHFRHAIGDFDYGLRARKAGLKNYITPTYIGTCEENKSLPRWCYKTTPLHKRFEILYSPLGYAEPFPFFYYEKRHFGLRVAIKHFISVNLRALFPQLWQ